MPAPVPLVVQKIEATGLQEILAAIESMGHDARAPLIGAGKGRIAFPDALVADAVHFLSILHGELPSILDLVGTEVAGIEAALEPSSARLQNDREWLAALCRETAPRIDLHQLTEAETLVRDLRDGMHTLARSSRAGCAIGAALAFLVDWPHLRSALDVAGKLAFALRWPAPACRWNSVDLTRAVASADALYQDPANERAIIFGAQQFVSLHIQLLDLLSSRADARRTRLRPR